MYRDQRYPSRVAALLASLMLPTILTAAEPVREQLEKSILVGPESARQWSAAECTIEASKTRMRTGQGVLYWHVTVDYFSGEPNYPIGWPRIGYTFKEAAARDWSGWDYFQIWVYTDTTRIALPREPAGLAIYAPTGKGPSIVL